MDVLPEGRLEEQLKGGRPLRVKLGIDPTTADIHLGHTVVLEKLAEFEEKIRAQMRADRPLKREGTAEDVAEAALYFATDRSRYVTGTVLPVDGGTSAGKVIPRK